MSNGHVRWGYCSEFFTRGHGRERDVDRLGEDIVVCSGRRGIPPDAKMITGTFVGFFWREDSA